MLRPKNAGFSHICAEIQKNRRLEYLSKRISDTGLT